MSNGNSWRATFAFAAGCALVACGANASGAQGAPETTAQLRVRLVNARFVSVAAQDSLDQYKARRLRDLPPDSITDGAVRLRYDLKNLGEGFVPLLRAAAGRASAITEAAFGDAARVATANASPIMITRIHRQFAPLLSLEYVQVQLPDHSGRSVALRSPLTERKFVDAIVEMMGTLATNHVPQNVDAWVGYWTPARPGGDEDWKNAALDLATSTSTVTRACYAGSVAGCESALGLVPVRDPLTEWYTSDGWRVLVSDWSPAKEDVALVAAHAECVEGRVSATCERLARMRPIPQPLNMSTRASLFSFAIEEGGRTAYTKILEGKGTPAEILSSAAGMSTDELVNAWRARVLAAVPHSAVSTPGEAVLVGAWTLAFGFAATRRRSS